MYYEQFRETPEVRLVDDPQCAPASVIIQVAATGLCLSDWHGWQGHDQDIRLPHVPGHEFAGHIVEVGREVRQFKVGQRVTTPFIQACGRCDYCREGRSQVCPQQRQAGFTDWGSFAEYVEVTQADFNLVPLPDQISMSMAALLGCRYGTAFHAVMNQALSDRAGHRLIFGFGGVGKAILQIEKALGNPVIVVDIHEEKLRQAEALGADLTLDFHDPEFQTRLLDEAGNQLMTSYDAVGSYEVVQCSLKVLSRQGRHIQIGLLPGEGQVDLSLLIAHEKEMVGSHGIPRQDYSRLFKFLEKHKVSPEVLISHRLSLPDAIAHFVRMPKDTSGLKVISF